MGLGMEAVPPVLGSQEYRRHLSRLETSSVHPARHR